MSLLKRFTTLRPLVNQSQLSATGMKRFFSASSDAAPAKYSGAIRAIHWGTAGCFLGAFYTINVALRTEGEEKARLMKLHESFGATAALLIFPRLYFRFTQVAPKHVPGNMLEHIGALSGHAALYAVALFLPLSGIAMALLGGKGFDFWGAQVPGRTNPTPSNGKTARALFLLHRDVGLVSELLTIAHVSAIPYHWVRGHGNILTRII